MKTAMAFTLVAWIAIPAHANSARDIRHDLDQYMARITARGFSGAILIAKDGRVILTKGYGKLGPRGGAVTADTVFDLASVTKQLTAAAVLKLEMQGALSTSDRISKYLPDVPKDKEQITIHHLLTHTAGVPDDVGGDYDVAPRDATVQKILSAPLESVPGEKYSYSNAGYSLLAALIERISGAAWGDFANQYLFQPAHMRDTGYRLPRWHRDMVAESFLPVRYPSPLDRPGPYWNLIGNGGVLSTVGDLYRWHQALNGNRVLPESEKKKLFTPYVPESPGGPTSYGYGWVIQKTNRGTTLAWHNGGSDEGFTSYIGRYLDEKAVIIFLSNSILGGGNLPIYFVPDALEKIVFGGAYAIPPASLPMPDNELERYRGTYRMSSGGTFVVSVANGCLSFQAQGRDAVGLLMYPDAERSPSHIAARIGAAFDAIDRGDFSSLESLVGPEAAADHVKRFGGFWRDWTAKLGGYQGTMFLYSAVAGTRRSSYVELKFQKGTQVIRAAEDRAGHVVLSRSGPPMTSSFTVVPVGSHEFSYFDFRSGKNISINFSSADDQRVSTMVLHLPNAEMRVPIAGE